MKKILKIVLLALSSFCVVSSFAGSSGVADMHVAKKMECKACHKSEDMKAITQDGCVECHGNQKEMLAKTGDKFGPVNPHFNHQPKPAACIQCHRGHKAARLTCSKCHDFEIQKK